MGCGASKKKNTTDSYADVDPKNEDKAEQRSDDGDDPPPPTVFILNVQPVEAVKAYDLKDYSEESAMKELNWVPDKISEDTPEGGASPATSPEKEAKVEGEKAKAEEE